MTAVITKQVSIADGRQDFAERLEEKILRERPKDAMLLKKEKLLEMLAAGAELAQSTPLLEEKKDHPGRFRITTGRTGSSKQTTVRKIISRTHSQQRFCPFLEKDRNR
ncbi:hypothetical protein [Listeria grayi]|uniref:Flagellar biosynthesis regulator FlhF n=1 Tax=Listeria grayi FSL F6-1183 TaxID=1265827 RepID=A0A829R806_LISGR|nr:hypothetical protein [Listeria grayi]EUJ29016.1 flagellar biosynthesis regulator FlhF [Listeria grayi FSL F6-1183]